MITLEQTQELIKCLSSGYYEHTYSRDYIVENMLGLLETINKQKSDIQWLELVADRQVRDQYKGEYYEGFREGYEQARRDRV